MGPNKSQFSSPHGFCLGLEEEIIVADTNNHRIQVFEKTGDFKYQFGVAGKEEGQLWYPRKVFFMNHFNIFFICYSADLYCFLTNYCIQMQVA